MREKVEITFNKDHMTVKDLKTCTQALESILRDHDRFKNDPEEMNLTIKQIRDWYKLYNETGK